MRSFFIETYGCQMNQNDSEIVNSILTSAGFFMTTNINDADIILLNTCSVRSNAEERVLNRLDVLGHQLKKNSKNKRILGILGCMAERLKEKLLDINDFVHIVIGPDEYRKLPEIIEKCYIGNKIVSTALNKELYDDIVPVQYQNSVSGWVSIMRGCNNFCSYCIVPYVRGRERSRNYLSIINEISNLEEQGFKEINLLGQNVNSYIYNDINFPKLLEMIAKRFYSLRIRFMTSHPRNMNEELIRVMANYENICEHIHLALQSGSDRILNLMNRKYTSANYLELIHMIRKYIPNCALSTDIIAGYPSETLEDHNTTLKLMQDIKYDSAFMFRYSPREGTKAFNENDDVLEEEKIRRLNEIINLQNSISLEKNKTLIGKKMEVLVEIESKKSKEQWLGKSKTFHNVIFNNPNLKYKSGDIVNVKIENATSATLLGKINCI